VQSFVTDNSLSCLRIACFKRTRGASGRAAGLGWVLVGLPIGTRFILQFIPTRNRLFSNSDFYAKPVLLFSIALN